MPGVRIVDRDSGRFQVDRRPGNLLAANSLTGATALYDGDLLCRTTVAALTANGVPVVRRLLAADKTAHYQDGAGNNVGLVALSQDGYTSDANGRVTGNPYVQGGVFLQVPNEATATSPDPVSGRSILNCPALDPSVLLSIPVNINTTDFPAGLTLGNQYDGTLVGLIITTINNISYYSLQPAAAAADKIFTVHGPDLSDRLVGTLVTGIDTSANNVLNDAIKGPRLLVRLLDAFSQINNGRVYTAQ
jgi:hypothetical protein